MLVNNSVGKMKYIKVHMWDGEYILRMIIMVITGHLRKEEKETDQRYVLG